MAKREDFHTITPYMCIRNAGEAIEFFKKAFGATETGRHADPDGLIRHAEMKIGDSHIMFHDEAPEFPEMKSVQAMGGSPVNLFLYIEEVDAFIARAVAAGAKQIGTIEDKPYGRSGGVTDPFGLTWWVTSHTVPAA